MARNNDVFQILPETLVIGTNVNATLVPIPYQNGLLVKYGSGGTLTIQGITFVVGGAAKGSTFATAQQYLLGPTEIFNANICGPIVLNATGTTTTVFIIRTLSEGSDSNTTYAN